MWGEYKEGVRGGGGGGGGIAGARGMSASLRVD
jgi:hypothetical protein